MRPLNYLLPALLLLSAACNRPYRSRPYHYTHNKTLSLRNDSIILLDKARNRQVPVMIYRPEQMHAHIPVVILSHGYNRNLPGAYRDYSYMATDLASSGYCVVSIQHELPTDDLIPMTGNIRETRMPFWQRGADNIHFVLRALPQELPGPDYRHPILIGHSNGGDMSMLFAHQYPRIPAAVISLDNRRMPLPRCRKPRICSLRSADQAADSLVLPTAAEQQRYDIRIIQLTVNHNDMDNDATEAQRKEIMGHIHRFLALHRL